MNNSHDPLSVLHGDELPVAPDAAFAARLRARLESAVNFFEAHPNQTQGVEMSGTDTAIAEINEPAVASAPPRSAALPYLSVANARDAIAWYVDAFGATVVGEPIVMDDGRIGHAELAMAGGVLYLADEYPEIDFLSPKSRGGTTVTLHVYVKDVDALVARAVAAGARITQPVQDKFYGDRTGTLEDPFGHVWHFATHVEDLSMAELRKRAQKMAQQQGEPK